MNWVDKFKESLWMIWVFLVLVATLIGGVSRQAISWLLTKLYEFFIGGKDHIAPV